MFGNSSRIDAHLNTVDKTSYWNWFCKDNNSILRANSLPMYGQVYFPMLYEVLDGSAHVGKRFLKVNSNEDIDVLMDIHVSM